jgi:hypothetical protein
VDQAMLLSAPAAGRSRIGLVVLWLLVPAAAIVLLAGIGDPIDETASYLITWLLSVLVPGVLLWRALAGGRSVAQDLGFGAVLGIAWQLAMWAVCTAIGLPQLQWVAIAGLVLTFLLVPSLRQHLGLRGTSPAPATWWHLLTVVALLLAMVRTVAGILRLMPLPPVAFARNQDVWYQLGLVQLLRHDVRPSDPSVLGEPLIYHWFANASIASQSVMSGVEPPQVLMHQWPLTFVLSLVLAGWAAGEALSERAWVGPIAGALAGVLPGNLQLAATPPVAMSSAQQLQAPSGSLAVLVMLGLVGPTVLILRRQGTKGVWAAMVLLLALSAGTKPTLLPIMVFGCVAAGLLAWLAERRFPWHQVALAALAVGFLAAASAVNLMGSTGGSRLQLLAALRTMPFYKQVTGDKSYPATGGWVVPSLASGNAAILLFAATLLAWYLFVSLPQLFSLLGTTLSPVRRDPAYWWAAGCVAAGTGITLVLSHAGYSEYYFLRTVVALSVVAAAAMAAGVTGEQIRDRRVWMPLVIAATTGFVTAGLIRWSWPYNPHTDTVSGAIVALVVPFLVLAGVGAVVILWINRSRKPAAIAVQAMVLVMAASLPAQLNALSSSVRDAVEHRPLPPGGGGRIWLSQDQQAAMLWLHDNAAATDVAVSNVFCMPVRYRPRCPDDAFWVSGLSGLQQYLGGWAYAPENLRRTKHKRSFLTQPSPWPGRLRDSLDAVERPTPELLTRLSAVEGVDWVVADLRAGPVSPALDQLAVRRFQNGGVRIYHLR